MSRVHWRGDHKPAKEHSTRSDIRVASRDQPLPAGQLDIFSSARLVPRRTITSRRLRYDGATHRQQWGEVDHSGPVIISALGALHSNFLACPRIPFAMARDGYFFAFAKRVQPLYRTPTGAIFFQACV